MFSLRFSQERIAALDFSWQPRDVSNNLRPVESSYADVVARLKSAAPDFFSSYEYDLVQGNDDLPGVMLAAFGRFLSSICADSSAQRTFRDGVDAINALYASGDILICTSIHDEFIESFDGDAKARVLVDPLLSASLRAEFARILDQ